MKKLLPFLLLLLLITFSSWSPMWAATHTISGKVLNQTTGEAVDMATVRLFSYHNADSTLVQGLQTDQQGGFVLTAKDGAYAIIISSVGFLPKKVRCTLSGKDLTLRPIRLEEDVLALGEIQVQGHAAEMTVKGDTIEYNTAAYKVGENAMVEDVLKKMNGVTVDKEGNVTVNGESITAVRIDGKKFFGNDVQSATKNIPADMIDKIQVIDEKSEMAKLTGFEDDDSEHIINLTLKKDRKKGLFGKYTGALGTDLLGDDQEKLFHYNYTGTPSEQAGQFFSEDFRYNASIFTNILLGESQTTVIGSVNNTNEIRMGRGRGTWGMDANSGITRAENLGVNTNIDLTSRINQKDSKTSLLFGGDAAISHSDNYTTSEGEKTSYAGDLTYLNTNNADKRSKGMDVNARFEIEYQIDSLNKLQIQPRISYTGSNSLSHSDYAYTRDSLAQGAVTISDGYQNKMDSSRVISASSRFIYNHKFLKPGRAITTRIDLSFSNTDGFTDTYAFDNLLGQPNVNQHTLSGNNNLTYSARISYVEPLHKTEKVLHLMEFVGNFSGSNRNSNKDQYSYDPLADDYTFDSVYSNNLKNDFYEERLEVNYRLKTEKSDLTAGIRGIASQTHTLTYYGGVLNRDTLVNRFNIAPTIRFRYKFGKKEFARINYRGNSQQPSITQMEPVRNNSNAMQETVGNLGLAPAFLHNLFAMYSRFNEERFSSIMTGFRASFTQDALVNNSIYDETGKLYQQTVNADVLPFNVGADFMYNTPFCHKMLQFHTRTAVGYNQRVAYINREGNAAEIAQMLEQTNGLMLGDRSLTGNFTASEDLTLRFTHNIVDLGLNGKVSYSRTQNSLTAGSVTNAIDWSVTGDVMFHLPRQWEIAADCGYTARYGYTGLTDVNEIILNASIDKTWRNATLSLKAYDLLHQKKNIRQVVGENYVSYQKYNTLPTYVMLTFTYKLNRMGNNKAKGMAGMMQEMEEKGGNRKTPPVGPPPFMR